MYKMNFLTRVLVRADCVVPMDGMDAAIPPGISKPVMKKFPVAESEDVHLRGVAVTMSSVQALAGADSKLWKFFSRNRQRSVAVGRQHLLVEYYKYSSFAQLKDDFSLVTGAVFGTYPDTTICRLGLRYVDTIEIDEPKPLSWRQYIKPKLLGIFQVPGKKERDLIARAFHTLELSYADMNVRFQYGVLNPDHPSPVKRKQFILDCDTYCTGLLEQADIDPKLDVFHEKAKALFEDSITDGLRAKMNE